MHFCCQAIGFLLNPPELQDFGPLFLTGPSGVAVGRGGRLGPCPFHHLTARFIIRSENSLHVTTGREEQAGIHLEDMLIIPGAYITDEIVRTVLERQCNRCAGCNAPLTAGSTHFDLRQPVICGGSHTSRNFEALCPFCHQNRMRRIRVRFADHRNK